jgi:hypothetical protein
MTGAAASLSPCYLGGVWFVMATAGRGKGTRLTARTDGQAVNGPLPGFL